MNYNIKENNPRFTGFYLNRYGMHYNEWIYFNEKIKRDRGNVCEKCGNSEHLDLHHKDKNRRNNELDNIEVLCRSCHMKTRDKFPIRNKQKHKHTLKSIKKMSMVRKEAWERGLYNFKRDDRGRFCGKM